jgi:hypothetical protein
MAAVHRLQESPLTEIIFTLGLRCQFDGAAAVGVDSNGFLIDGQTAAHGYRAFSGMLARCANAERCAGGSPSHRAAASRVSMACC